jgi:cellobiose phosphorylase
MTDIDKPITRQAIAAKERSGKLTVSGKLKVALDCMLFEAASRADAATKAGMTDHSLRAALRKPHVSSYYRAGLEVLRTSERAKNISVLAEIRDKSDSNQMARVAAVKTLEQLSDAESRNRGQGIPTMPGLQIVIVQPGETAKQPPIVDVTPNDD